MWRLSSREAWELPLYLARSDYYVGYWVLASDVWSTHVYAYAYAPDVTMPSAIPADRWHPAAFRNGMSIVSVPGADDDEEQQDEEGEDGEGDVGTLAPTVNAEPNVFYYPNDEGATFQMNCPAGSSAEYTAECAAWCVHPCVHLRAPGSPRPPAKHTILDTATPNAYWNHQTRLVTLTLSRTRSHSGASAQRWANRASTAAGVMSATAGATARTALPHPRRSMGSWSDARRDAMRRSVEMDYATRSATIRTSSTSPSTATPTHTIIH